MSEADRPIGVFDSGVGGLSVLREIRRELPAEDLFYVADSRYAPYGDQSDQIIKQRASAIARFLVGQSAKAIVVACNTATGAAIEALRSALRIPVIGIEPAIKPAALTTRSAVIGVLATTQTLSSAKFSKLLTSYGAGVRVLLQPCPGLVEQVEAADFSSAATRALVARYVEPLLAGGADTLVLGCTHYPFLTPIIREVAGPDVVILDPAAAVARELHRRLDADKLLSSGRAGSERFWTSGMPANVQSVAAQLWTGDVHVEGLPADVL